MYPPQKLEGAAAEDIIQRCAQDGVVKLTPTVKVTCKVHWGQQPVVVKIEAPYKQAHEDKYKRIHASDSRCVPLMSWFTTKKGTYLIQPFYGGGNLRDHFHCGANSSCKLTNPKCTQPRELCPTFSTNRRVSTLLEVVAGLEHLHKAGFVHGALHSKNILLTDGGGVILTDMRFEADRVTPAWDVYELGAIIFEVITYEERKQIKDGRQVDLPDYLKDKRCADVCTWIHEEERDLFGKLWQIAVNCTHHDLTKRAELGVVRDALHEVLSMTRSTISSIPSEPDTRGDTNHSRDSNPSPLQEFSSVDNIRVETTIALKYNPWLATRTESGSSINSTEDLRLNLCEGAQQPPAQQQICNTPRTPRRVLVGHVGKKFTTSLREQGKHAVEKHRTWEPTTGNIRIDFRNIVGAL